LPAAAYRQGHDQLYRDDDGFPVAVGAAYFQVAVVPVRSLWPWQNGGGCIPRNYDSLVFHPHTVLADSTAFECSIWQEGKHLHRRFGLLHRLVPNAGPCVIAMIPMGRRSVPVNQEISTDQPE
jgi:hypothetical protein